MANEVSFSKINEFVKNSNILKIFADTDELNFLKEDEINRLAEPNSMLWELRVRLWRLIEDRLVKLEAFGQTQELKIEEIINGICSRNKFMTILDDKFKCEFLSRPIRDYENSAEDLVRAAQARIWEVLALPIKDSKGLPCPKMTKIVFDCAKMVIDRKYGQALQKTELYAKIQSQSLSISGTTRELNSPEAIDAEIALLEEKLGSTTIVTEAPKIAATSGKDN